MTEIADGRLPRMDVQIGSSVYNVELNTRPEQHAQRTNQLCGPLRARDYPQFTNVLLGNDNTLKLLTETATQQRGQDEDLGESNMSIVGQYLTDSALMVMMGFFLYNMFQSGAGGGGMRGAMNFGKSPPKDISKP